MDNLKEKAKRLIEKGKRLNDLELIEMAMDVLEMIEVDDVPAIIENVSTPIEKVKAKAKPKQKAQKAQKVQAEAVLSNAVASRVDHSMFQVKNPEIKSGRSRGKPVTANAKRVNLFVDDGKEAKGPEFVTPDFEPSARRPPVESTKVSQTCEICGKKEKVLPGFVREYYRCEACLLKGRK